jgi:hypothetical protein
MMMSTRPFCGINLAHLLLIIACIGGLLQLRPGLKQVLEPGSIALPTRDRELGCLMSVPPVARAMHASSLCAIQLFGSLDIVIVADDRRDILVMGLPLQPRRAVVDLPLAVRGKRFIAPG